MPALRPVLGLVEDRLHAWLAPLLNPLAGARDPELGDEDHLD